jgi:hypothetical protein
MKKRKMRLAELRSGQKPLNYGQPPKWLVEAVGQDMADAAVLFDALSIEMQPEGVTLRLGDGRAA